MNIPALIAAIAFLIFCVGVVVFLLKFGAQLIQTLKRVDVTLDEANKTIEHINRELDKVDDVTNKVQNTATKVTENLNKFNAIIRKPLSQAEDIINSGLAFLGIDKKLDTSRKGSKPLKSKSAKGSAIRFVAKYVGKNIRTRYKKRHHHGLHEE